jgi:hypothetical protein
MNVQIFSPEKKTGETLTLNKISGLVWKHHGSVKLLVSAKPHFKPHSIIVIRMDDTTFLATWDDTDSVGLVSLTMAELKEFTTGTVSDKGKHITFDVKNTFFIGVVRTVRSRTRNTNGNGRPYVQIETEV